MIKIVIESEPLPAARPRFSGRGVYEPAKNKEYKLEVQMTARREMKGRAPFEASIEAVVKLYRKYRPTSKRFGDVDNHLKAIFDAMNQIVFVDDSQIIRCQVEKHMDKKNPRAEIFISPLGGNDD